MAHLFCCLSAFPRYAFSLQLFMVRFCSESLLVVPVFFSVVRLNLFLWKNLLQRPLGAAGLSALMSVVFGSDSAVLFIFLLRISVMTFYLWHSLFSQRLSHHSVFELFLAGKWFVFLLEQMRSALLFLLRRAFHTTLVIQAWSPDSAQRNGSNSPYKMRLWVKEHSTEPTDVPIKFLFLWFCCSEIIFPHEEYIYDEWSVYFYSKSYFIWGSHWKSEDPRGSVFKARRNH